MKLPQIGPGILVTAAFIGPGTVITASVAGANFGYALIWALLFSIFATIILQEMAGRLGLITGKGLGENIRENIQQPIFRFLAGALVVSAIIIGNAAYQGGNISGATLGLTGLFDTSLELSDSITGWPIIIGLLAFFILWQGQYKVVEKLLLLLVLIMSIAFLITFFITQPDFSAFFSGLLIPRIPDGATLTVIALIGTTVVPYNLFLHSSSVSEKWQGHDALNNVREDLYVSIPLGGIISIAIVSTAAAAFFGKQIQLQSAADLAPALQPLFGEYAKVLMAVGLFAAGISSAITAPLASAYALSGILNLPRKLDDKKFKSIWIAILTLGVILASTGYKPVNIIWFAQVANGLLLPITCAFLIWIMNSPALGIYKNSSRQNVLGACVMLITLILSAKSLSSAFGLS